MCSLLDCECLQTVTAVLCHLHIDCHQSKPKRKPPSVAMFVARRQGWLPVTSAGLSEFCVLSGFFLSPIAEVFFLWEVQITVLLILFHVFKKKKKWNEKTTPVCFVYGSQCECFESLKVRYFAYWPLAHSQKEKKRKEKRYIHTTTRNLFTLTHAETGIVNLFSSHTVRVPSDVHAFHDCDTSVTVICKQH